ncbi:MAG: PAS domain S-box protein [Desulfobacteraceae bacterium]|nr:PAS domain S-box protein [Desulfobacteraceae bacterium]
MTFGIVQQLTDNLVIEALIGNGIVLLWINRTILEILHQISDLDFKPKYYFQLTIGGLLLALIVALIGYDFPVVAFISTYSICLPTIYYIWQIFRRRKSQSYLINTFCIIYIIALIHLMDYPFLRLVEWFAPYGFTLHTAIHVGLAVLLPSVLIKENLMKYNAELLAGKEELKKAQRYIANIIDSMPSILIGVDINDKVTQWNKEAQHITGISSKEAMGQSLESVMPRLTSEMKQVHQAIADRVKLTNSKKIYQEDGVTHYEDIIVYPLIANGAEGAVIRIDDVTDKVRMEEMMIQSEKMLSIGGLAAGMAHEINNPLAGMTQTAFVMSNRLTNIEMPANRHAAEEIGINMDDIKTFMEKRGILEMIKIMKESGHRVAEIVTNMLNFARKSEASVSSHDMPELFDKILELAATDYNLKKQYDFKTIKILSDYEDDLPMVPCEGAEIQQVLLNILRNGAQAMQETKEENSENQPEFILRLSNEPDKEKKTNMLCIEIEDNGPGMDAATQKRIFEPFFTTKPAGIGTGLDLSVPYFIITENHGGTMDVISKPGKGTTFIICLPLDRKIKPD